MKKAGIFTLSVILIVAMFAGCRRQTPDTTVTTTTKTQTTTKTTAPTTKTTAPTTTGSMPEPTDLLPSGTDTTSDTQMPRQHRGPRY